MKKWGIIGALALIALGLYVIITYNDLVGLQNTLRTTTENNQNVYSSVLMKMKQAGIIAKEERNTQIQAYVDSIKARYGDGGSKGVMTWIQEQNPRLTGEMYSKALQIVESGYNEIQANQTTVIDNKRLYYNKLDKIPSSWVAKLLGFTKKEIDSYTIILKSEAAKADYATGTMSEQNIFKK
ncbi:MAG: hypothetical protein PHG82_04830 [Candidatus Gracilibacteria bacterium]|nr:hypothetical protein [Candidatus Gracilibacteria bacterium]